MCAEEKLLSTSDSHAQYGSARRPSAENKINATIANTSVFIEHGIVAHRRHHVSRRRSRIHLLRHDGFRHIFEEKCVLLLLFLLIFLDEVASMQFAASGTR